MVYTIFLATFSSRNVKKGDFSFVLTPRRAVLQSGAINAPWSNISPQKSLEISEALIQDCGCQVSWLDSEVV